MARIEGCVTRLLTTASVTVLVVLAGACAQPDLTVGVPNVPTTRALPTAPEVPSEGPEPGGAATDPAPEPPTTPEATPAPAPPLPPDSAGAPDGPDQTAAGPSPAPASESPEPDAAGEAPEPGAAPPAGGEGPELPPAPDAPAAEVPLVSPAPQPGLTDSVLRVGVIADVETGGVSDNRSAAVHSAVRAWAAAVNDDGGLAGRSVEVVTLDAGLFGHAATLAQACAADLFALVGSDAMFDDEGIDLLGSPDCELVDFPARTHSLRRAAAPRTFVATPSPGDVVEVGALRWVAERQPVRIRSTATFFVYFPVTVIAGEQAVEAARSLGFELVYDPTVSFGVDLELHVAEMMAAGAHHLLWEGDTHRLLDLLRAAEAAGLSLGVNCGDACHGALFWEAAGAAADGVVIWSRYLPLTEEEFSPELRAYRTWLAAVDAGAEADLLGVAAWSAGRLFEEAVRRATGAGTPGYDPALLSLSGVVEAAKTIVNWNGNGLHGVTNPGTGEPTPCGVVMGFSGGSLYRFSPVEPGTFDCSPENLFDLEATATLGLDSDGVDGAGTSGPPIAGVELDR